MLYTQRNSKKRFVHTIVIIFIIITILSVQFYTDIYYLLAKNGCKDAGLCLFYNSLNPNMNFEIPIIILSIPSAFLLEQYHINHFNKFDYYIKERIGFKKYIYQSYVRNFINSFLLILSIYISMIFVIHFFLTPIFFSYHDVIKFKNYTIDIYNENIYINMLIYLILSGLGFALFSTLILSLKNMLKQKYLFKISSIVIGVILAVLPVIVGDRLFVVSENYNILILFSAMSLLNLIFPGVSGFGKYGYVFSPILVYLISFIIYSLITIFTLKIEMRREYNNEE